MLSSFKQFLLLTFFFYFLQLFPSFFPFWVKLLIFLPFPRHFTDGNISKLLFFYRSLRNSQFHIVNGVTPLQAVLQEELKPPNVWELYKAERQSQGYSPLHPMTIMLSSGYFYENQYWDTFRLEASQSGVMDSLVACKHSSEFRHCRIASSPKDYSGFCLKKLQCLSDLWYVKGKVLSASPFSWCTSSTHLSYSQGLKGVGVTLVTFNTSTCFWVVILSWQFWQILILFLLPPSDACNSSRKKFGLVHLFKMQRSLSQYSFAFFSVILLKT